MTIQLWKTSTSNAFSSSLNGSISAVDTSITITSSTGLRAPGILCIDRQNSSQINTPTFREYISFTGIAVNTLTGCSRGLAGSAAQAHTSGAIIEENFSTTHWGDLLDFLAVSHDANGNIVLSSSATLTDVRITNSFNASGASILGNFPIHPVWVISGFVSAPTTGIGKPLPMPQAGNFQWFSAVLRTPASGASLVLDIHKNGTSIFTDQNTRLTIGGGNSLVSTASIGNKAFNAGDIFTIDIDTGTWAQDLTILGRAT